MRDEEPLEKCLKMTMPWSSWPNYAFEHKLCLIEWPMDARPPDGAYYDFKDAANGLEQVQINLSNQRRFVNYLDEHAIQIVSWKEEDMDREIDDPDLREVPLVFSIIRKHLVTVEDSVKFTNELAESQGLSEALKKKVKRNNAVLPRNLYDYLDDPSHAKSSKAQADCDKRRASGNNDNRASKRLHASTISDDDTDDEERVLEEQLRQIRKLKKNATKKGLPEVEDTEEQTFLIIEEISQELCLHFCPPFLNTLSLPPLSNTMDKRTLSLAFPSSKVNRQKTIHIGLCRSYHRTRWDRKIERAEVERIKDYKAMDIMKTRDIKRPLAMSSTDTPAAKGSDPNEDWICLSLMIEEQQQVPHCLIVTEYEVKILHRIEIQDKEEDRKAVEAGHDTIAKQLTILAAFQAKAGYIVQDLRQPPEPVAKMFDDLDEPPLPDPDANLRPECATAPENTILPLPSSANIPLNPLHPLEIKLRIKQANRYLQNLCGDIAKKSFLYTNDMHAKTIKIKVVMTQARGTIAKINYRIMSVCWGYLRCCASLAALGADRESLKKYAKLEKGNTKSSTALLSPNEPQSTQLQLSWIWLVDSLNPDDSPESLQKFQCVYNLWAQAMKHRWEEEVTLLKHEIKWTAQYFKTKSQMWQGKITLDSTNGQRAYSC
ncbi:hypothetical protein DXG01_005846 [Tephrocybe rancida]|nr:hypothetical protein DXG01_005846 [Tephrocybe rancida]